MHNEQLATIINEEATKASSLRQQSRQAISEGRKLRKQAHKEANAERARLLLAQGEELWRKGVDLRSQAEDDRLGRRLYHLTAAMLHGKTYLQCEAKCDTKLWANNLGNILKHYVPKEEVPHVNAYCVAWLKGDAKFKDIRQAILPVQAVAA